MTSYPAAAAVLVVSLALSSCTTSEPPPKTAPPDATEAHEAAVRSLFQTPELKYYLMLSYSFVGSAFPAKVAGYLREVEQLEGEYILLLQESPQGMETVIAAHQAFEEFARGAAELYEVMSAGAAHVKDMREGLVISDQRLMDEYNRRVDEVNGARDALEAAIQALTPDQRLSFRRMGLDLYAKQP